MNGDKKEPIVLGVLKKEKASKPSVVIIIFLLLIGTAFALPTIKDYIAEGNNPLNIISDLYNKYFGKKPNNNQNMFELNSKTILSNSEVTIKNIVLENGKMTYDILSKNNETILDNSNLYIEIFNSNKSKINTIKLTGTISTILISKTSYINNFTFDSSSVYYGRISNLTNINYSEVTLTNNILSCSLNENTYNYVFNDNNLLTITQTFNYVYSTHQNDYLVVFNHYKNVATEISKIPNCEASVTETDDGFSFKSNVDTSNITQQVWGDSIDYNYYPENTSAKIIHYEMNAKGFICQ